MCTSLIYRLKIQLVGMLNQSSVLNANDSHVSISTQFQNAVVKLILIFYCVQKGTQELSITLEAFFKDIFELHHSERNEVTGRFSLLQYLKMHKGVCLHDGEGDQDRVQDWLRDVRVEMRHGRGEGGDVVGQAVVGVLEPGVQTSYGQCDQIWLILKLFGDKFSSKSSPNIYLLIG